MVLGADDLYWNDGWLEEALAVLPEDGYGFVGLNNGKHTDPDHYAEHYLVSRDYAADHWGGVLACPHYHHYGLDPEASALARRDGVFYWAWKAIVEHRHYKYGFKAKDETYRLGDPFRQIDKDLYTQRKAAGFPIDYEAWFEATPGHVFKELTR